MNRKTIFISVATLGILWGGWHWLYSGSPNGARNETESTATSSAQPTIPAITRSTASITPTDAAQRSSKPTPQQLKARYQHFMANRPAYLDNIDLPGRYSVDEEGNLIVDAGLKEMLDFFLQTIGDLPFDQIHDLIAGSMITALQEPALSQALALLDDYFVYLDAYHQWQQSFDKENLVAHDPVALRDHMQTLSDLRREHLGDIAHEAFFAELEQVNAAYLDAQIALQQPNLTATEKDDIRAQLKASLPAHVRAAQEASMTLVTLTETTNTLKKQGANEQQLYQARASLVGEEAAKRLAQVDDEKRLWAQKRNQYKALLEHTPGLAGMTDTERTSYIANLAQRELGLAHNEIKRMQALDRIEAAESTE